MYLRVMYATELESPITITAANPVRTKKRNSNLTSIYAQEETKLITEDNNNRINNIVKKF